MNFNISANSVIEAIRCIEAVPHNGSSYGNINLLSAFLLLKQLGCTYEKWIPKDELLANSKSDDAVKRIFRLGAIFDENEYIELGGCIFFSAFSKNEKFNQATKFTALYGRFKDTVDNAIADKLLDRGNNNQYRLSTNAIKNINLTYSKKFNLYAVLIWLYRFDVFEKKISFDSLKSQFKIDFNISEAEIRDLFDLTRKISLAAGTKITGDEIRTELGVGTTGVSTFNPIGRELMKFFAEHTGTLNGEIMSAQELYEILLRNHQLILTGPPGTGKSYLVDEVAKNFTKTIKIQFHQNYSYQDFVIGKTIKNGNVIETQGPLLNLIQEAADKGNKDKSYLLVLDEINRGNTAAIFGEFLHLLDRDKTIQLKASESEIKLQLPNNLFIVGTMNSTDRSIALIDYAIRRRFMFIDLKPDYDLVDRLSLLCNEILLGNFLEKLNEKIISVTANPEFQIGHSYFIRDSKSQVNWSSKDFVEVVNYKIKPMLKEYLGGSAEALEEILPNELTAAHSDAELISNIHSYCE